MVSNPILSSSPPAIADVAPARLETTRPRTAAVPPTVASRPPAPVVVSAPVAEDVRLQWDKDSGVVIKFTDKKSGEVMRQIPSDQMLSVAKFIRQLLQPRESESASSGKRR